MEKLNELLEKYLEWGEKTDFSEFEDYINRNINVDLEKGKIYDEMEIENILNENIYNGIKHYADEFHLYMPVFEQLFGYDKRLFDLSIIGKYKEFPVVYKMGEIDIKLSKKMGNRQRLESLPIFKIYNKNDILLTDFLKTAINSCIDKKISEYDLNLKTLENLKKKYQKEKTEIKKLKIK